MSVPGTGQAGHGTAGQDIAGATAIAMAAAAGILTLITKGDWWSYAMAVGFIAALLASGSLLLPANTWPLAECCRDSRG